MSDSPAPIKSPARLGLHIFGCATVVTIWWSVIAAFWGANA